MPLRDDHEAALARADALQRQLDQERARGDAGAEQVKRLDQELAEARTRLRRAEAELSGLRPDGQRAVAPSPRETPKPPWLSDRAQPPDLFWTAVGGLVMLGICILLYAMRQCQGLSLDPDHCRRYSPTLGKRAVFFLSAAGLDEHTIAIFPQRLKAGDRIAEVGGGDANCNVVINPTLLRAGWEEHFGYLKDQNYAVVVGEFGGNLAWPLGQASIRDRDRWSHITPGADA